MKIQNNIKYFLLLFLFISFASYAQDRTDCTVTNVVDGDTFDCETSSGVKRIRLIGMNTPEKNTDEGKKASIYTASLLNIDSKVDLELDVREYGPYKRLLAYVYLQDGTMLNELLVREGYAQVATYPPNVKYVEAFKKAQEHARMNKKGLWEESDGHRRN